VNFDRRSLKSERLWLLGESARSLDEASAWFDAALLGLGKRVLAVGAGWEAG